MKKFSVPFIMRVREVKEVNALNFEGGFMLFIAFWTFVMVALMAIGGFFMFRKFLKALPKEDGRSDLDWQAYYIEKSLHLWGDEAKELLNELVSPVPDYSVKRQRKKSLERLQKLH